MCRRRGGLPWFVPRASLRPKTAETDLGTYTSNTHQTRHHFCPSCGISPFSEDTSPDGGDMATVNVRYLEGMALESLTVMPFDGASK